MRDSLCHRFPEGRGGRGGGRRVGGEGGGGGGGGWRGEVERRDAEGEKGTCYIMQCFK